MRLGILNVEHGFYANAVGSDGGVLLSDFGHCSANRTSTCLPPRGIVSIHQFLPRTTRNSSMTSTQIRSLKTPPLSPAMTKLLDMIDSYTGNVTAEELEPVGLWVRVFFNTYPPFTDTNDLSLLTFIDGGDVSFVRGGDLERDGWLTVLENPPMHGLVKRVGEFVTSHHGRQSSYCPEVFIYYRSRLVVMSDGPIQHDTQLMASASAHHVPGELCSTPSGREAREVVTTRKDGNISCDL